MSTKTPSRSNTFLMLLSLPATAMGFGLAVQISALSWMLSSKYGLAIDEVGFVWLAGPLAGIIGQLLAGVISDKIWFWGGRRRPLIIIGGIIAAAMLFLLPRLGLISEVLGGLDILAVALTVALGLDLAINIGFNPTRSIIADMTQPGDERTKGYTIMQTVSGLFGVLAYFIALIWGKESLIYVGVVILLCFNLIPSLLISEPKNLSETNPAQPSGQTKTNLRQLMGIYIAHAFTWLGVQTMFVYLYAFVNAHYGIQSNEQMGEAIDISFLILNTVGFILPALALQPLSKKFGKVKVHALAVGSMALGYAGILAFQGSLPMLYLMMGILGIGWAATVSLPFAIMTEYVEESKTGLYMGIFNLSVVIPQLIVSGILGSVFKQAKDSSLIFVICTVALAVSALLWWVLVKEKVKG